MTTPLVTTTQGILRGIFENTTNDFEFYSFLGIPYAQPPLGELRFKDPQPPKSWIGIRDATKEGSTCYHTDILFKVTTGSEDCLYLNVYTPKIPTKSCQDTGLPVMVFFHGGGFKSGSGRRKLYGPEFLIDKSVLLVTMNFRLGMLGFLTLEDENLGVFGNASLKDQNMGLRWVQENIAQFGGDPNNVTIFGESSGGACVGFQIVSPMGKGLFHKGIMQSGVASAPWALGKTDATYDLVRELGKSAKNDAEALNILQDASIEELNQAQTRMQDSVSFTYFTIFGPIIEKHSQRKHLFLPDYPINLIKSGNYNKIPIIIGATSGEGLSAKIVEQRLNIPLEPKTEADFVPNTLRQGKTYEECTQLGAKIQHFYYGEQDRQYSPKSIFYDYAGDANYFRPALDFAEHMILTSNEKMFMYLFCLKTKLNMFSTLVGVSGKGCCHVDDLYYLFKAEVTRNVPFRGAEKIGIQRMTKWWTNFAKYSDPNGLGNDPLLSEKWVSANPKDMQYMEIDTNIKLKFNFHKKNNDFWKSIENDI